MEFYKEGKILGLTAGERLDLGSSQHNHKAALIFWDGSGAKLEFYTKGTVSLGVTFGTGSFDYTGSGTVLTMGAFYKAIIPVRLASITPDTIGSVGRVILLN